MTKVVTPGVLSYKRTGLKKFNPRAVLYELILKFRNKKSKDDIQEMHFQKLWNSGKDREAWMRSLHDYFYHNNWRSLVKTFSSSVASVRETDEYRRRYARHMLRAKAKIAGDFLLDLPLPGSDLALKEALGSQVAKAAAESSLLERFLFSVCRVVQPNQRVGDVLSEDDLQRLLEEVQV